MDKPKPLTDEEIGDIAQLGQMLQTDDCDLTEEGKAHKQHVKALLSLDALMSRTQ